VSLPTFFWKYMKPENPRWARLSGVQSHSLPESCLRASVLSLGAVNAESDNPSHHERLHRRRTIYFRLDLVLRHSWMAVVRKQSDGISPEGVLHLAISDDSGVDFCPSLFVCASEIWSQVKVCFFVRKGGGSLASGKKQSRGPSTTLEAANSSSYTYFAVHSGLGDVFGRCVEGFQLENRRIRIHHTDESLRDRPWSVPKSFQFQRACFYR
jgi:hypothetical protein